MRRPSAALWATLVFSLPMVASAQNLTSVTPNPMSVGAVTVTLNGNGFQSGATVMDTSGETSIKFTVQSLSSTTIIATGTQPPSAAASFTVTNPGGPPSNAVVVPVGSPGNHTLTVVNGTGGGSYAPGTPVPITAVPPSPSQTFKYWTGGTVQSSFSTTTILTMPGADITETAVFSGAPPATKYTLTVVNGSGSGSYVAGATVSITANAPSSGNVFASWVGAPVQNQVSSTTTLSMPATNATVTATYSPAGPVPYPVASHPRLWVTPSDLTRLRSWANGSNPIYSMGMQQLLSRCVTDYETQFFPGGVPNPNYPDFGDTQGYTGLLTEDHASILAFNSLIDPSASNRIKYAQYARNLLMYAMNQANHPNAVGVPFCDPGFAVYNRASGSGENWALAVDWIYNAVDASGNPILTSADKLTIRNVFMKWAAS